MYTTLHLPSDVELKPQRLTTELKIGTYVLYIINLSVCMYIFF